jgi:hypothetical protein
MTLDLPHGHAAGVERDHLVVEALKVRLPLGDKLRLETSLAVPRHGELDLAVLTLQRLRAEPVPRVAATPAGRVALLVTQVLRQLGVQRTFDQRSLQLLEKPFFPQQILRLLISGQQLV